MTQKKKKPTSEVAEVSLRCEKWFAELLGEVAAATERSAKGYMRYATTRVLKEIGLVVEPIPPKREGKNTRRLHFDVPMWFHTLLEHGAGRKGMSSVAEFVRQCILECAARDGFPAPPDVANARRRQPE